jgi:hypothetical protein
MTSPYAGKPFRPSNGTGGDIFRAHWCDECEKDRYESKPCRIFTRTLIFGIGDKEYPKEWTYDDDGAPQCTAFVARGSVVRKRSVGIRDKRQQALPI